MEKQSIGENPGLLTHRPEIIPFCDDYRNPWHLGHCLTLCVALLWRTSKVLRCSFPDGPRNPGSMEMDSTSAIVPRKRM